jgi:hypothetical protein
VARLEDRRENYDWPGDLRALWQAAHHLGLAYSILDELAIDAHILRAPEGTVAAYDSLADLVGAARCDLETLAAERLAAADGEG